MNHYPIVSRTVALALVALVSRALAGFEQTVQNDSEGNGSTATPCQCFLAGESVAAWLTAPVTGEIVAVQVLWKSPFGSAPDTLEMAITVFDGSTFPAPGAPLVNAVGGNAVIVGPTLQDGLFNEFRHLDVAQTIPLRVPVSQGQTFAVALEFINTNSGQPFAPTVTYDADGCQAGLNAVNVMPGGWADACPQGVTGDWVIRAVVDDLSAVPAVSTWGLMALVLLVVVSGSIKIRRQDAGAPCPL